MTTKELKPTRVFGYFEDICRVPRSSKHEEKMTAFLKVFGESLHLETQVDEVGNVLIRKPATPGYENRKTLILQSHIDMVCEKNKGVDFDFETNAIRTVVDGEWLKADGTTLGADNGIGVATELAVLTDNSLKHGPIECVFTVDEETGLTGANAMKAGFMSGDILLNLDSEDEGEMFIGCAGGVRTNADFDYQWIEAPADYFYFKVGVQNLLGGHSGDDIDKGHANANKLLNRFLCLLQEKYDFYLCEIEGGGKHNAIPREAVAVCAVPMKDKEAVRVDFNVFISEVEAEYAMVEKRADFYMESHAVMTKAIDRHTVANLLKAIHAVFNGVFAMSMDVPGLVETSSNLASVRQKEEVIEIISSQRSSVLSARKNVADTVAATYELAGARVEIGEGYPGWKPNTDSEILQIAVKTYKELFQKEPKVKAIHAGLECGLFLEKYPWLDMISFGPTMRGVHSPDERLLIPTVELFWKHLVAILENAPLK